jgi:uncharacterized protein
MAPRTEVSAAEARRIALAAQGFAAPRPRGPVGVRELRGVLRRLGLVQIDYVNVLIPAHYQVFFSRLGPYDTRHLDHLVYGRRECTEQWAHEASIVPVEAWPLLRHRREAHRVRPRGFEPFLARHAAYVAHVLEEVRARGPLTADDLPEPEGVPRRVPGSWLGTVPRVVLEAHFGRGALAVAERRAGFVRAYDLSDRVVPAAHHVREVGREEAERELLRRAARAHGIAAAADLADYYRMPIRESRPRLRELVEAGELVETRVEGWKEPAYLHRDARQAPVAASALLSPFDPVVWYRPRALRVFGFDYRVEIFVPRAQRRYGFYVLPFLLGDRLSARVDLKADRQRRRLQVLGAWLEPRTHPGPVAQALAAELRQIAEWLELDAVAVERRGDLARRLAGALAG